MYRDGSYIIFSPPQTNTYQGALVTDGVQSYALFTYKCGEMGWSGGATIGFGASDELYDNLRLGGSAHATIASCLNSPTTEWSNILYKLTQNPGTCYYTKPYVYSNPHILVSL